MNGACVMMRVCRRAWRCGLCSAVLLTAGSVRVEGTSMVHDCFVRRCAATRFRGGETGAAADKAQAAVWLRRDEANLVRAGKERKLTLQLRSKLDAADEGKLLEMAEQLRDSAAISLRVDESELKSAEQELRAEPGAVVAASRIMCAGYKGGLVVDVAGYDDGTPPGVDQELKREGYHVVPLSRVVAREPAHQGTRLADKITGKTVMRLTIVQIKWHGRAGVDITGMANNGPRITVGLQDIGYIMWYEEGQHGTYTPRHLGDGWQVMTQSRK